MCLSCENEGEDGLWLPCFLCSDAEPLQHVGWGGLMLQPMLGQSCSHGAGRLRLQGWEGCTCLRAMNNPPALFLGSAPSWQRRLKISSVRGSASWGLGGNFGSSARR